MRDTAVNVILISARFAPDHVRITRSGRGYQLELGRSAAASLAANVAALRFHYGAGP